MNHRQIRFCFAALVLMFFMVGCGRESAPPESGGGREEIITPENIEWIDAYYSYAVEHGEDSKFFSPSVVLVDLDFDGAPEILNIEYANGSLWTRAGLTYKDGKALTLDYFQPITDFIGTARDEQGKTVWFTGYYPFSPHRWPDTCQIFCAYDFSALPVVEKTELLYIGFVISDYSDDFEPIVIIRLRGEELELTDEERLLYLTWYDRNAESGEDINLLPHLARLETELRIEPQKSLEVEMFDFYYDDEADYEEFKTKMLSWYY